MSKLKPVKKKKDTDDYSTMTVVGHLSELRKRILMVGITFLIAFGVCFFFIREIADYILSLGLSSGFKFVYLAPSELLTAYIRLSISSALCFSLPNILFQSWCFVAPALSIEQKKAGIGTLAAGFLFFLGGITFAYKIALPTMVQFLVNFNTSEFITSNISVGEYLRFVIGILMTFGLIFEMPILSLLLSALGIMKPEYMVKTRRYAIVLVFVLGAIITPPDIVSQTMIALPMLALYQISIWVSMLVWKTKSKQEEQETTETTATSGA